MKRFTFVAAFLIIAGPGLTAASAGEAKERKTLYVCAGIFVHEHGGDWTVSQHGRVEPAVETFPAGTKSHEMMDVLCPDPDSDPHHEIHH